MASDSEMDLSNAGRGIWLVKVPKYIANKWEQAPGNIEVGKLKIAKTGIGQKSKVTLTLSEPLLALKKDAEEPIPKEHQLDVSTVTRQVLGVFSQESHATSPDQDKIFLEGRVVQKLDCRPIADDCYMNLKAAAICRASMPERHVRHLDRHYQPFKPVSDHKHNIEYAAKKKAEGKRVREDREAVLEMLYAAFEKHQYYNIKDLVKITRQPVTYLKDILKEVCNYNLKNPHRNMWELKPEYRHYKVEKGNEPVNDDPEETMDSDID